MAKYQVNGSANKTVCWFGEEDDSTLVVSFWQKVKMKDKGVCIYRGNYMKDKGTL